MKTAVQWKAFYAEERTRLGEVGLAELLDRAPELEVSPGGALIFPHTRLSRTGRLTAAVARAVVRSGADEVLALGVLHGGREEDADTVRRARAGDSAARLVLRRVYEAGDAFCGEEFSLDNFVALLALAATREGTRMPQVHARYPFLVEDDPASVPGIDDVTRLVNRMPIVATTDPIHHGAGYGTREEDRRSETDEATQIWARGCIEKQLELLGSGDWTTFASLAAEVRSDFRDDGPVLAHVLRQHGFPKGDILELDLVDYADVLAANAPTWVAAPLIRITPGSLSGRRAAFQPTGSTRAHHTNRRTSRDGSDGARARNKILGGRTRSSRRKRLAD